MSGYHRSDYTGEEIDRILGDVSSLKETIGTVEGRIESLEQNLGDGSNFIKKQNVNQPLGVAGLDEQGELNIEQIPSSLRGNVIDTREMAEETSSKFSVSDAGLRYYGDINIVPSPLEWFSYTTDDNYNVHIDTLSNKYLAAMEDADFDGTVVIPYEIDGKKVVSVGGLNSSSLVNVIIPNTVTFLEAGTFMSSGLTSISIPHSITYIGDHLFSSCHSLTEVILPNGITHIDAGAFMSCSMLESIKIPDTVEYIGDSAFEGCYNLKNIVIPNDVNKIYSMTFDGCSLDTITIPESVEEIECTFNERVTIICRQGSYAETYAKENGFNYVYDVLSPSEYVGDIKVEKNILKVTKGDGNTTDLTLPTGGGGSSIDVDEVIQSVSNAGLKYYGDAGVVPSPEEWFIIESNNGADFTIKGLTNEGKKQTDIVIPYESDGNEIIIISEEAFLNCTNLISITIPDSVALIGGNAFVGCNNLKYINIPKHIHSINTQMFVNCTNLTSIAIPNGVTTISMWSFAGCTNLTSITIPDSVIYIDAEAFMDCNNLTIICSPDSYAETYAENNGINYVYDILSPSEYVGDIAVQENILKVTKGDGSVKDLTLPTGGSSGGSIVVDEELSDTSENPVQNKVISEALKSNVTGIWALSSGIEGVYYVLYSTGETPSQEITKNGTGEPLALVDKKYIEDAINENQIIVDENLDTGSTNPVQNKAITETFHKISEDLTSKISSIWSLQADENVYNILFSCVDGGGDVLTKEGTDNPLDLVDRKYVDNAIGDVETALDNIIAIQNTLIGGDSV